MSFRSWNNRKLRFFSWYMKKYETCFYFYFFRFLQIMIRLLMNCFESNIMIIMIILFSFDRLWASDFEKKTEIIFFYDTWNIYETNAETIFNNALRVLHCDNKVGGLPQGSSMNYKFFAQKNINTYAKINFRRFSTMLYESFSVKRG